MRSLLEIKRENLLAACEKVGGRPVLAKMLGISDSQINQWISASPDSKTGRPRSPNTDTCRKVEKAVGLPENWMEHDHGATLKPKTNQNNEQDVIIQQYDAGGSMGHGINLEGQTGLIHSWSTDKEWLKNNVKSFTSVENLAIVTGFGDSMRPDFNPGDPLLVDRGVKEVRFDAIYFFRIGNDGFIKRVQRIPSEQGMIFRAISKNPEYESFDITKGMDFEVLALVLKIWCGKDY